MRKRVRMKKGERSIEALAREIKELRRAKKKHWAADVKERESEVQFIVSEARISLMESGRCWRDEEMRD